MYISGSPEVVGGVSLSFHLVPNLGLKCCLPLSTLLSQAAFSQLFGQRGTLEGKSRQVSTLFQPGPLALAELVLKMMQKQKDTGIPLTTFLGAKLRLCVSPNHSPLTSFGSVSRNTDQASSISKSRCQGKAQPWLPIALLRRVSSGERVLLVI